jgi:hypothetical protein
MLEPNPPTVLRHQVLADPTGRRRRRLAIAGRAATAVLGLWLVVLILGGLGLQPLAGLPIIGHLGAGEAAPPALPERVQAAVVRGATVAPARRTAQTPVGIAPVPSLRPAVTAPFRGKTRTPPPAPGRTKTTPGRGPVSPASSGTTTSPSSTAPGQTRTPPGQTNTGTSPSSTAPGQTRTPPGQTNTGTSPSSTAPGQTRTPPGQTKTGSGPSTSTPGTTPSANGTVTTP